MIGTGMAELPADPGLGALARRLGLRRTRMAGGEATMDLTVGPDHLNPYGVVHGAVVYALVDTAMGAALVSRLETGERCATLEVKIQYLAPVAAGGLRAEARLVERTRRIAVLEARVWSDGDRLVALATGTFYVSGGSRKTPPMPPRGGAGKARARSGKTHP
jgi:acyl-CoA thioesterase